MSLSKEQYQQYLKRIALSRVRILLNHGFYGLLLMNVKLLVDENCDTAFTDGNSITFGSSFLDQISDKEIDFILMHEILHIALRHCSRQEKRDNNLFNIACDIVVNSNILKSNNMNIESITLNKFGESMHLAPNNKEGYLYTAEEVYEMLIKNSNVSNQLSYGLSFDDHSKWGNDNYEEKEWIQKVLNAKSTIDLQNKRTNCCGNLPLCIERMYLELTKPKVDWKTILNEFVQEIICDYSFFPPDKRFHDYDFFLPDFNDKEKEISNILFMVDTSGSISNEILTNIYSELKGALEQFNDKLEGYLGFFDAKVIEPIPFSNIDELLQIKPYGGGGTKFDIIFDYVNMHMRNETPKSIIILTDGYAPFPDEVVTNNIPVLWIIVDSNVIPPWGKYIKI